MAQITITVDADAELPILASLRAIAGAAPSALSCPVDEGDLKLLLTEVAANAVQAQSTRLCVTIDRPAPSTLRVAVTDDGKGEPVLRPPDRQSPDGRGLAIVEAISSSWGVHRSAPGGGTTVWFQLTT